MGERVGQNNLHGRESWLKSLTWAREWVKITYMGERVEEGDFSPMYTRRDNLPMESTPVTSLHSCAVLRLTRRVPREMQPMKASFHVTSWPGSTKT